jgi:predicted esterase YcpF (UPF0227 family)
MIKFSKILEQQESKTNILYIHGLNGNPNESDILKADNVNIISKKIDYDNIDILDELLKEKIDAVIGHSLGGLLAYHISNIKKIPSLLFNPAFEDTVIKFNIPVEKKLNKNQIAVIGLQDDVILAETQIKNLKKSDCKIYIENIGHDISDDIKTIYFNMFISNLFKDEDYSEYKSTFIHNDIEYDLNKLFDMTSETKAEKTDIKLLDWVLQYTDIENNRVKKADINIPIIITNSNNKLVVLDGVHRLQKSIDNGNEYILTKFIDEKELEKIEIK